MTSKEKLNASHVDKIEVVILDPKIQFLALTICCLIFTEWDAHRRIMDFM